MYPVRLMKLLTTVNNVVVGDEAAPGTSSSSLQTNQEVSFSMAINERKLASTNQIISED